MEIDPREYFGAVEDFLREIQGLKVRSICMVALTDDPDTYDVVSAYDAGPMELAACAGILQMHAAYRYGEINRDPPGNSEDAEE